MPEEERQSRIEEAQRGIVANCTPSQDPTTRHNPRSQTSAADFSPTRRFQPDQRRHSTRHAVSAIRVEPRVLVRTEAPAIHRSLRRVLLSCASRERIEIGQPLVRCDDGCSASLNDRQSKTDSATHRVRRTHLVVARTRSRSHPRDQLVTRRSAAVVSQRSEYTVREPSPSAMRGTDHRSRSIADQHRHAIGRKNCARAARRQRQLPRPKRAGRDHRERHRPRR